MGYFIHEDQPAGLPFANLEELNDVNIENPADGDALVYDSTAGKWQNSNITPTSENLGTNLELFRMGKMRLLKFSGFSVAAGGFVKTLADSDKPAIGMTVPIVVYITSKYFDGYLQMGTNGNIVAKYFIENSTSQWAVPAGGEIYGFTVWFTA